MDTHIQWKMHGCESVCIFNNMKQEEHDWLHQSKNSAR